MKRIYLATNFINCMHLQKFQYVCFSSFLFYRFHLRSWTFGIPFHLFYFFFFFHLLVYGRQAMKQWNNFHIYSLTFDTFSVRSCWDRLLCAFISIGLYRLFDKKSFVFLLLHFLRIIPIENIKKQSQQCEHVEFT